MPRSLAEELQLVNRYRESAPVDVESLVHALGIRHSCNRLRFDISGMLKRESDKYAIIINAYDPRTRQRFTTAHELGHYFLHRDKIGDGIEDDRLYRASGDQNTRIGQREETQANQFAANLLMPYELIKKLQSRGIIDPIALARELEVSEQAMRIRLGSLEFSTRCQ